MKFLHYFGIPLILFASVILLNTSHIKWPIEVTRVSQNETWNTGLKQNESLVNRNMDVPSAQSVTYRKSKIAGHVKEYFIQPDLSKEDNKTILVFVCSTPNNGERRMLIRKTWANATHYRRPDGMQSLVTIFVIGLTDGGEMNESVVEEAESFSDILTVNITESYANLVYKVKLALDWINEHSSASYIFKVDEDVIINTCAWIRIVDKMTTKNISCFVAGHAMIGGHPHRAGKYQVPIEEYSDDVYPYYCEGPAYMITRDALAIMLEQSTSLPPLRMEDVYFTGILVHQTPIHQLNLGHKLYMSLYCCARLEDALDENLKAITVHYIKEEHWQVIWQHFEDERNTDRRFAFKDFTDNKTVLSSRWRVNAKPKHTCTFNSASFIDCC